MLSIRYEGDTLSVYRSDPATLSTPDELLGSVAITSNPPSPEKDSVIMYAPSYDGDIDESGLGTVFLNLEAIFPCIAGLGTNKIPRCTKNTFGEDGLNKGRPVIGLADNGKRLDKSSSILFQLNFRAYAFAVPTCTTFTPFSDGCLRTKYDFEIVCYLPRSYCAD